MELRDISSRGHELPAQHYDFQSDQLAPVLEDVNYLNRRPPGPYDVVCPRANLIGSDLRITNRYGTQVGIVKGPQGGADDSTFDAKFEKLIFALSPLPGRKGDCHLYIYRNRRARIFRPSQRVFEETHRVKILNSYSQFCMAFRWLRNETLFLFACKSIQGCDAQVTALDGSSLDVRYQLEFKDSPSALDALAIAPNEMIFATLGWDLRECVYGPYIPKLSVYCTTSGKLLCENRLNAQAEMTSAWSTNLKFSRCSKALRLSLGEHRRTFKLA